MITPLCSHVLHSSGLTFARTSLSKPGLWQRRASFFSGASTCHMSNLQICLIWSYLLHATCQQPVVVGCSASWAQLFVGPSPCPGFKSRVYTCHHLTDLLLTKQETKALRKKNAIRPGRRRLWQRGKGTPRRMAVTITSDPPKRQPWVNYKH